MARSATVRWPRRDAIGYGLPWAIGETYYRITRREGLGLGLGLGLGDGMLLALVGALLGWRGVLVALFGGSMIGSVVVITAVIVARVGGGEAGEAGEASEASGPPGEAASEIAPDPAGTGPEEEKPSLRHTELPFGPFLAMGAVLYLFAEPWFHIDFHLPL